MRKLILIATIAATLAVPASASALTYSQAWYQSFLSNINQCNNAGYGLYRCAHSNYVPPNCYNTGVNESGRTQWNCYSQFVQNSNVASISSRLCYLRNQWGPYGGNIDTSQRCINIGGVGLVWYCHVSGYQIVVRAGRAEATTLEKCSHHRKNRLTNLHHTR